MFDANDATSVRIVPSIWELIDAGASAHPDRVLLQFEDDTTWSWNDTRSRILAAAALLQNEGVTRGTRVATFVGNGAEMLLAWWATALLGAVIVPLNFAYRGSLLRDIVVRCDPEFLLADAERAAHLADLDLSVRTLPAARLLHPSGSEPVIVRIDPWEPHAIILTSGTTGPSKASITSYAHVYAVNSWVVESTHLGSDDCLLVDIPLFHMFAWSPILVMLGCGGRIALRERPSMTNYWEVVHATGATYLLTIGSMLDFLASQPPSSFDRSHRVRLMLCSPLPDDLAAFKARFGVEGLITGYGSTEVGAPIRLGRDEPMRNGTCGKLRPGYEVRLVDEHDLPIATGQIGEATIRATSPWLMSGGYLGDPLATAAALRNGWFHTGDLMSQDDDGYFYVHGRSKDMVRRRGENISSYEVEREVLKFEGITDAACVGVPTDVPNEDEVKVYVVVDKPEELNHTELIKHLAANLAHFMVPRYLEIVEELPRGVTHKVEKYKLRAQGNTAKTWDSQVAGLRVTRHGVQEQLNAQ